MTQYAKRKIDITINIGEGPKGDIEGQSVTLTGHRAAVSVLYAGGVMQAEAQVQIAGLPLSMINRLTGLGPRAFVMRRNTILIAAGDEGGAMSTVYQGQISHAHGNFDAAPDVTFEMVALAATVDAVKPVGASSYRGAVNAAAIMKDFADSMGIGFEDSQNLVVMLQDAYFPGDNIQKIRDCAKAARICYSIEYGKLVIWQNGCRALGPPIKISAATGMVGYPSFTSVGVTLTTLFHPDLVLARQILVESDLTGACGLWNVIYVAHTLESETPNGKWFTQINANRGPQ